ncbi:SMC-Scp complex subunit ScpB [Euzebya tangerina]|uniref:SMC-Scp complex subunit ScpB n=1 Tax=Euzebya tangerina TaxID=591198 RepID=UPI000E31F7F9|nr:SMC-Scp complex subunit ScpB [Euzebya tangerina]
MSGSETGAAPAAASAELARSDEDPSSTELRLEPELRKALEAILLVVDEPVDVESLAQVLEVPPGDVEDGLLALAAEYIDDGRGFVLRRVGGGWRMYTDPGAARYVEQFVLHGRTGRLSQAALETLAIVAYKQPVTRSAISEIRGVDADAGVRKLVSRGLVEEIGREDSPGQPLLYGTTSSFLEKLGLDSLDDLPALPDLSPGGPPPPEPAPGGYKAARKELISLEEHDGAVAGNSAVVDRGLDGPEDEEIDRILSSPTPKPGERLTALLEDPFDDHADDDVGADGDGDIEADAEDRDGATDGT